MSWQDVWNLSREANQVLGLAAFICLGYRAVIGLYDRLIVYRPMFVLFVGYVFVAALGAPVGIAVGNGATFLSGLLLLLNVATIVVCVFSPGPLKRS